MTPIAPETLSQLSSLRAEADQLQARIRELGDQMAALVPKCSLEECRAANCVHALHCKSYCQMHQYCVRSKWAVLAYKDYYVPRAKPVPERREYPTLSWAAVTTRGAFYRGAWHCPHQVVKETDKTLILDDGTPLLKSTLFQIEDCTYIKDRSGGIYFPVDTRDAALLLLKVRDSEMADHVTSLLTSEIQL